MDEGSKVQIAVPPGATEASANEAVAVFADALAASGIVVELAPEPMKAPIQAGPFNDFGISVAASLTASLLWALAGPARDGVKRLYERLNTRFTGRAVVIYVRVMRPDGKIITYRLPVDAEQGVKRIELIIMELSVDNPNSLTW